jgi:hypothetical protein
MNVLVSRSVRMPELEAVHQAERQSACGRGQGTEIVEEHLPEDFEVQAGGTENLSGALTTARKRASGVWEGEKALVRVLRPQTPW